MCFSRHVRCSMHADAMMTCWLPIAARRFNVSNASPALSHPNRRAVPEDRACSRRESTCIARARRSACRKYFSACIG